MKVSELTGVHLDYWVAKAAGLECEIQDGYALVPNGDGQTILWRPSQDWSQAGPIIEKEWIGLNWRGMDHTQPGGPHYSLRRGFHHSASYGNTQLEAAMRAFVASKFGQEIRELVTSSESVEALR